MRIGFGFDTHALKKGTSIRLGGINIDSEFSIVAHSDGDIIFHACADAIYGALAEGDLGDHFPDNDVKNKNIDSSLIIKDTKKLMKIKKYTISNLDITLVLEEPRISKYKKNIVINLSKLLELPQSSVNLKITTNEKIGYIGRNEGISCYCVVLLSN
tara:strand:- start:435 stop:905 length:471 start_codon:yes stop_codon:yes gene_type:complete